MFETAGVSQPIYATIGAGVVNTVFTVVSVSARANKTPRVADVGMRPVLIRSPLPPPRSSSWWSAQADGRCT